MLVVDKVWSFPDYFRPTSLFDLPTTEECYTDLDKQNKYKNWLGLIYLPCLDKQSL